MIMRTSSLILSLFLVAGIVLFDGCKKEETPVFNLVSLMTDGGLDLAGASAATNVPEDAMILATFSSDVDATTANTTSIMISRTDDMSQADYSVSVSGAVVTVTPTKGWDGGTQFTIDLAETLSGSNGAMFKGNSLTFRTSGIFVPQKDKEVLFLSFDNQAAEDEVGDHTVTTVNTLSYVEDRRGTANAAAYFDGSGNLVEVAKSADIIPPAATISFWIKTDLADYDGADGSGLPQTRFVMGLSAELGYFLEMGRRSNDHTADGYQELFLKYGTDQVNIGNNAADVPKATVWYEVNGQASVGYQAGTSSGWSFVLPALQQDPPRTYFANLISGKWTQLVMTVDPVAQEKTLYINGVKTVTFKWLSAGADWLFTDLSLKDKDNSGNDWPNVVDGVLALGNACSSMNTQTGWCDYQTQLSNPAETKKFFKGAIDQFRIFSVPLSETEVSTLYDNEK